MSQLLLFLCPHSAAKSVLAAAYCQRLVNQQGLDWRVEFAGTEPDEAISPAVVCLLEREGFDLSGHQPRLVTAEQLATAFHVVSMGCDLADLAPAGTTIEKWDDIPPVSQNPIAASDLIHTYVEKLIHRLA